MSFSKNLKKEMKEKGMTQTMLSELTGMSKSSISQYISGKSKPRDDAINKIAEALNVPVAELYEVGLCGEAMNIHRGERNVPISVAANLLNKSQQFIRIGLQMGILPFGVAVKMSTMYTYHISPKLLDDYMGVKKHDV